jgi:hypothetical protein
MLYCDRTDRLGSLGWLFGVSLGTKGKITDRPGIHQRCQTLPKDNERKDFHTVYPVVPTSRQLVLMAPWRAKGAVELAVP